jgi:hypothetical protein
MPQFSIAAMALECPLRIFIQSRDGVIGYRLMIMRRWFGPPRLRS